MDLLFIAISLRNRERFVNGLILKKSNQMSQIFRHNVNIYKVNE